MAILRKLMVTMTLAIILLSCNSRTLSSRKKVVPLFSKDTTKENEKNNRLFVFIGEKITVTPISTAVNSFDYGVKAKYAILSPVYGFYDKEIIEFEAYDHYGIPAFTKYKDALLFVSEYKGKFYQEKYMYDPLFKTKDGRWAGPYSKEYDHEYNENTTVRPQRIDFAEEVSFPTKIIDDDGREFTLTYPEPYFNTVGAKAFAVYGNYVEELFKLRKDGVLTARGLFGDKPEIREVEIKLKDVYDTTKKK
jgi:hypothetical protein